MKIIWTNHALELLRAWENQRGISASDVERDIRHPEQTVAGDRDALVAQAKWGDGLLRIPFVETAGDRRILTLYWTSRIDRYWAKDDTK